MNRGIIIFLIWITTVTCYSQENYSMDENRITQYEMDMTEYPKDTEAEAVVIYETGDYSFVFSDHEGLRLRMTIHTKIKILSQAGEKYATFEIPLYKENDRYMEELESISGITYNIEDGKLIKTEFVPRKNIFDEKINEYWIRKKFTLPNAKVGSIIEVKYTIKTPLPVNMREWKFQKKIPVIYSKLKYRAIPYYEYVFSATNINKFDEHTSNVLSNEIRHGQLLYKEVEHTFALKNLPAFRDEEFISAAKDHMIAINFQLAKIYHPRGGETAYMSTWEELSKELLKNSDFGKYINSATKEAKKILPTLDLEGKTEKEKVKIISEYVKTSFNWNGLYGKYSTQKVSDLLKTKRGNVADINLFLIGLLTEAKVNVTPLILSTKEHGKINKSYPFIQYFNYTLAEVTIDGAKIFIDATEPMLPDRSLPLRCANTEALAIDKTPRWSFVRQRVISYLEKKLDLTIKSENHIQVKATYGSTGQAAYTYRTKYLGNEDHLIKYLKDSEDISVAGNIEVSNDRELDKPFQFNFSFNTKAEGNEEKIFINPFSNLYSKDNLFKQTNRTYPVDMGEVMTRRFIANINIPEGYKVEFLPEKLILNNEVMRINYQTETNGNKITIDATYSFLDHIYPAEKYNTLKSSYAKMLSKLSEMVVLTKE